MKEAPSTYPGLIFKENFASDSSVRRNGGTITSVTFANGIATFNGSSSKIVYSKKYGVKSIRIILKASTTTQHICKLSSTHSISVSSGTIAGTGISSPTIYVNGTASSTLTTAKSEIVITTATAFNVSDFQVGYISSTYLNGEVELIEIYNRTLTASEVSNLYNNRWNVELPPNNLLLDFNSANGVLLDRTGKTLTQTAILVKKAGNKYSAEFNGTSSKIVVGNIGSVQSLSFPVYYSGTSSSGLFDLNGTDKVNIVTGAITHYGTTCYINGQTTTTLSRGWNFVTIISTAKSATAFQIGYNGTNYFKGKIQKCRVLDNQMTLAQHTQWWTSNLKDVK